MPAKDVAIIGAGVVGSAIGHLLARRGYPVRGVYCRTRKASKRAAEFIGVTADPGDVASVARTGDIVFLTVPDRYIDLVCREIADKEGFREGAVVIHTSGALPSSILHEAHRCGALVGSIHPLMSFADSEEAVDRFAGIYCSHESNPEVAPVLRDLIQAMGGVPLALSPTDKALYHAAATTAANFMVTLIAVARELMSVEVSGHRQMSLDPLLPLVKSALSNVERFGIPRALTGPIERGDASVVRSHVDAISEQAPRYLEVYRELGKLTVSLALEKGTLSPDLAEEIHAFLEAAQLTSRG